MTSIRHILLILVGITGVEIAGAQQFEFTENKGQWAPEVRFKGEVSAGAFFLTGNGYRMVRHHPDDFAKIKAHATGHDLTETNRSPAMRTAQSLVADGDGHGSGAAGDLNLVLRSHAYDVVFEQANSKAQVVTDRELAGYSNYFIGDDPSKWASGVKTYGSVTYRQIYPGIDVRYYSDNGFLKYDLIVQPGAKPDQIVLRYDGVTGLKVNKSGDLLVETSVGEVKEQYPYTYQVINGIRRQVNCSYQVIGNRVRFRLSGYDPTQTLIIDPSLVFSTFAGSTVDNWGYTATYDAQGNAYGGGIVFGTGWPVTTGAFQTVFGGGGNTGERTGFDIGVMKLNPNGSQRIYATYVGGTGNEQPQSLIVDSRGSLILAGRTTSTNYPTTFGGIIGPGGQWDIVVTKLNNTGTAIVGSVRIGGAGDDGVNIKHKFTGAIGPASLQQNYGDDARSEVQIDASDNIYVASCSRSANFPVTPGVLQTALNGQQDGIVLRFNPAVALTFATYLGGSADDAAYVVTVEEAGTILVAGGTTSNDFPGDKVNTVGATYAGGLADGFVTRLNASGTAILKTTYVGTVGSDQVYGLQKDRNGFVYVTGTSTGAFGVRNAAYSQPGGKQFIAKMQPDFSNYVYSTVFGPNTPTPNISPTAFLVDRCENVYVSGWGGRIVTSNPPFPNSLTNGLPITPDAIKSVTDGNDFYFFVLEKDAVRQLYGSFFGQQDPPDRISGDHVDGGTSRFDEDGIIYQGICANCNGGQFPITPGVVSPTNPSNGGCNLAVVKIAFNLSGVRGGVRSAIDGVIGDTSGCVPLTVSFTDTLAQGQRYEWLFGDGSPQVTTTTPTVSHTFNQVGTYRVRLITIDETKCFPRDTSFLNIAVRQDRVPVVAAATKLEPCASNAYRFDNLSVPFPGKPFTDTSFTWIFGDNSAPVRAGANSVTHQYPAPGVYNVRLILNDTNYCNAPDTFLLALRVSPDVVADFTPPPIACAPSDVQFTNTSAGGTSFFWDFGNGQTSTSINPTAFFSAPGTYQVKLVAVDPTTCNLIDSITKTVTLSDKPTAAFSFAPNPPEENIITTFTNLSSPASRYRWEFGDGEALNTIRRDTIVRHQFPRTGTYQTCLIAINEFGCADTTCLPVSVVINPIIDVVSAFTPNNDGVNDRAVVFGFGVARMTFRIYNRWGEMVYESADPRGGWDGVYKGRPQPMDAYAYTLDAELIDGTKVRKSGSITLIR